MFPANLDPPSGCDGGSRVHTRPPVLRQGTSVCVHTSMVMEQLSDHKPITPCGMGLLVLWSRVAPLVSPWCARGNVPTGVRLNQYAGPGSHTFGPQYSPKLIISLSLGEFCGVQGASSRARQCSLFDSAGPW